MRLPLITLLLLSLAGCAQQYPNAPAPIGLLPGDTVRIEGVVLAAVNGEGSLWFQSATGGTRNRYKTEFDVRIESPRALAGLCQRFAFFSDQPLTVADWKGKKVTVSVTKEEAFKMIFFIRPDQVRLNQGASPVPNGH